jgi:hypothetical protein
MTVPIGLRSLYKFFEHSTLACQPHLKTIHPHHSPTFRGRLMRSIQHYLSNWFTTTQKLTPAIALLSLTSLGLLAEAPRANADEVVVNGGLTIRVGEVYPSQQTYPSSYVIQNPAYPTVSGTVVDPGAYYYYNSVTPYPRTSNGIVNSTLINPVVINSPIVNSTLINPVIVDSHRDPHRTIRTSTYNSYSGFRPSCTLMAEYRAACNYGR